MNAAVQALQARLEQMEHDNAEIRAQSRNERRRFRSWSGLALVAVVGAILVSPGNRAAVAQGYSTTLKDLIRQVKARALTMMRGSERANLIVCAFEMSETESSGQPAIEGT